MKARRHRSSRSEARPDPVDPSAGDTPAATTDSEATALALWIQPRASGDAVVGERDGMVAIRLAAPPVEGAANAALLRFLAQELGCPAGAVQLVRGRRGRRKWVAVDGWNAAQLRSHLLALSGS